MRAALATDTPARSQPSSVAAPHAGASTPAAAATAAAAALVSTDAGLASTVATHSSSDSAPSGDAEVSKQVSTLYISHAIHNSAMRDLLMTNYLLTDGLTDRLALYLPKRWGRASSGWRTAPALTAPGTTAIGCGSSPTCRARPTVPRCAPAVSPSPSMASARSSRTRRAAARATCASGAKTTRSWRPPALTTARASTHVMRGEARRGGAPSLGGAAFPAQGRFCSHSTGHWCTALFHKDFLFWPYITPIAS